MPEQKCTSIEGSSMCFCLTFCLGVVKDVVVVVGTASLIIAGADLVAVVGACGCFLVCIPTQA